MRTYKKKLLLGLTKNIFKIMPKNIWGDFLCSSFKFLTTHKRFPSRTSYLFNDQLFYLKVGSELDKPIRSFTTDKEYVKIFVRAILGQKYNVDTIAILKTPQEVERYEFPAKCAIKPTHASGWGFIRKNQEKIPLSEIVNWLHKNFYEESRERNYKNLEPKIIVEPLVFGSYAPQDYKFFCLNGKVKILSVDVDRFTNHRRFFYDEKGRSIPISMKDVGAEGEASPPPCFQEMIEVCEKLAIFFNFVRIDLFSDGEQVLVGEITHCVGSASSVFLDRHHEKMLSELLFGR